MTPSLGTTASTWAQMSQFRLQHLRQALGDRYSFEAILGRGAFATVFLVRNRRLGRHEALKVLAESFDGDSSFARRFIEEAKLVAALDHPNIVKVFDYGEVDGIIWYSMQYIDGPSLRGELEARGRFDQGLTVRLAIDLLSALAYSHGEGIVHRDIKPSNVLLDRRGSPFLVDFGIAKSLGSSMRTQTGNVLGTPSYMAPEQAESLELDGRADLYSLGLTLYEMLAGFLPFRGKDPVQLMLARLREEPTPLSEHRSEIGVGLEAIVMRSLRRLPKERFADAESMGAALDGLDLKPRKTDASWRAVPPQRMRLDAGPSEERGTQTIDPEAEALTERHPRAPREDMGEPSTGKRGEVRGALLAVGLMLLVGLGLLLSRGALPGMGDSSEDQTSILPPSTLPPSTASDRNLEQESSPDPLADESETLRAGDDGALKLESTVPRVGNEGDLPGTSASELAAETVAAKVPVVANDDPPAKEAPQKGETTPEPAPWTGRPVSPPLLAPGNPVPSAEDLAPCGDAQVILSVRVGEDGVPVKARALRSPSPACSTAATAFVSKYRFTPAKDSTGRPVPASTTITF